MPRIAAVMLFPLKDEKKSPRSQLSVRLEELEAAAEAALDAGHPQRAIELLHEALIIAPLDRQLRAMLADALLAAAERNPRKRASGTSRIVDTLSDEESEGLFEIEAPPAPRPVAPQRATKPKGAPGRQIPAKSPRALEAATQAATQAKGLFDGLIDRASDEMRRSRRSQASASKAMRSETTSDASPPRVGFGPVHRPRRRFLMAAALYAGISLVLLGAAQGMISYVLRPAELPEIPTAPSLPEEVTSALDRATQALAEADPRRAIGILEAVEEDHPAQYQLISGALARAWRSAGNQELDRRDYPKAAEAFGTATRLDPHNADNWIELGRSYREHGRSLQSRDQRQAERLLVRAQDAYERALEVSKDDPAALIGLAQTLTFLGNRNDAVARYERVLELAPDSREAGLARQHLRQLTGRS